MITTITGGNSYLLHRRLSQLVDDFVKQHGELSLERIDADEIEARSLIESISSVPFLASRRLMVLRDLSANKSAAELIEQIISAAGETTDLIFYEPQIDKRTSFYKVLTKKTDLQEFNELDAPRLAKWLVEEAASQAGSLTVSDANYLIERIGANQEMLANELTKLIIYNSKVSKENIELLTEPTPQSRIFDLLDASFGGDKKRALKLYDEQRAQKVEPQAILAMLAWQLQLIVLTKYAAGRSHSQIAKDAGINPYPLRKAASLASKLSQPKIKNMVDEAFKIDLLSKTRNISLDEALKNYILAL